MEWEMFSLEDDNHGNMFITQESSKSENLLDELYESDEDSNLFCGVRENDFQSPVVSKVNVIWNPMYLDISEDKVFEDFHIPSSQKM